MSTKPDACKTEADSDQTALSREVDRPPCPPRRQLLDFPDETLLEIFDYFDFDYDSHEPHAVAWFGECEDYYPIHNIKSLRLVCRRFCALASGLLVRDAHLDLSRESLARLQEISCHPVI